MTSHRGGEATDVPGRGFSKRQVTNNVPQTDTGGQVENTCGRLREPVKELGKTVP